MKRKSKLFLNTCKEQACIFRHSLDGTEDQAFAAASLDNAKHGLALKKCDVKFSVIQSLKWYGDTKTFREIAREVGCVHSYVAKLHKELLGHGRRQSASNGSVVSGDEPSEDAPEVDDVPAEPKVSEKSVDERMVETFDHIDDMFDGMSMKDGKEFLRGLFGRYGCVRKYIYEQALRNSNEAIIVKDQFVEALRR